MGLFSKSAGESAKSRMCDAQIGGCEYFDRSIQSVSEENDTTYEWQLGINHSSWEDHYLISRKDLKTGETTSFGWNSDRLGVASILATNGKDLYVLVDDGKGKKGNMVAKVDYSDREARFLPIDFGDGNIKLWELGASYACYNDAFYAGQDHTVWASCAVKMPLGLTLRDFRDLKLENQTFSKEGISLTKLDAERDNLTIFEDKSFTDVLRTLADVYTEDNEDADEAVGRENLQKKFGTSLSQPTILFLTGYFHDLIPYGWLDGCERKNGEQVRWLVNAVDERILQANLAQSLTDAGSKFPVLMELRNWILMRPIQQGDVDYRYPFSEAVSVESRFIPSYRYESALNLVRSHMDNLAQNKFLIRDGFPEKPYIDSDRPTQGFSCEFPFGEYIAFVKKDEMLSPQGVPFTREQLNIMLDFYAQFSALDIGDKAKRLLSNDNPREGLQPEEVRKRMEERLNSNPGSALADLRRVSEERINTLAASLQSVAEINRQNFAFTVRRMEEIQGFLAMLNKFSS